uniref:Copine C-terminal domain-containing protein n=1 Tax=Zea mays TaxID=4577 RepID=A0A804UH14_MAIZE
MRGHDDVACCGEGGRPELVGHEGDKVGGVAELHEQAREHRERARALLSHEAHDASPSSSSTASLPSRASNALLSVVRVHLHDAYGCVRQDQPARAGPAGPTSFAPLIYAAISVVENSNWQYHVLVIIADGQVTAANINDGRLSPQEQAIVDAK